MKHFIENNADLNNKNFFNDAPIHLISKDLSFTFEKMKVLVESKCDVNSFDGNKNTSLILFSKSKAHPEVIQYLGIIFYFFIFFHIFFIFFFFLVEKKADLNLVNNKKNTALHCACENLDISFEKIKFLVENKAEINSKNNNQDTPLHLACKNDCITLEIIEYLIEKKSDILIRNTQKRTAFNICNENKNVEKEIIKKYGEKGIEKLLYAKKCHIF